MAHTIRTIDELAADARERPRIVDFHLLFTVGELELVSRAMGARTIQAAVVADWVEDQVRVGLDELRAAAARARARQRVLPMRDPSDHAGAVEA